MLVLYSFPVFARTMFVNKVSVFILLHNFHGLLTFLYLLERGTKVPMIKGMACI